MALRLVLSLVTEGYPYDMSCFVAWGEKLAAQGPAAFYSEGYFADYPPGYLYVLGLVGLLRGVFSIAYESPLTYLLLALVPQPLRRGGGLAGLAYRHILPPGQPGAYAAGGLHGLQPAAAL